MILLFIELKNCEEENTFCDLITLLITLLTIVMFLCFACSVFFRCEIFTSTNGKEEATDCTECADGKRGMKSVFVNEEGDENIQYFCENCPNGKYRLDSAQSDGEGSGPPACLSHCDFSEENCPSDCDTSKCPETGTWSKSYVDAFLDAGCEKPGGDSMSVTISATKVSPDDTAKYPVLLVSFQASETLHPESSGGSHPMKSKIIVSGGSLSEFKRVTEDRFTAIVTPSDGASQACTINVPEYSYEMVGEEGEEADVYKILATSQFNCTSVKQCHDCPAGVSLLNKLKRFLFILTYFFYDTVLSLTTFPLLLVLFPFVSGIQR